LGKKECQKYKIQVIKLAKIKSIMRSEKTDFSKKNQYALELYVESKEEGSAIQVLYLACHDVY